MTTTTFSNVIRGVAYGDAWGDPNEFRSLTSLIANNPQGPDLPAKLRITDDTQMSLFLADALDITHDGTIDEVKDAIIEAFMDYYDDPDTGSRAPGTTVMGSLRRMRKGKDGVWDWKGATNNNSDGSGTVMRTSAAAFLPQDRWVGATAFAAAVTHGAANAIAAAILDVAILRELLAGKIRPGQLVHRARYLARNPGENGLLDTGEWLEDFATPGGLQSGFDELVRLLGKAMVAMPRLRKQPWATDSDPSGLIGGGYNGGGWRAHETLVIALMAVDMLPNDPWLALRRSVTTAGDSDTIGAVTGALLGAAGTLWPKGVFVRLEPRYQRWILNEADDYEFLPTEPESGLIKKILGSLVG